ncbi:hypothetical protein NQ317_006077 [Molorchus minor]|uniref:Platelet-derived growth factor (PDGF) family profile domain-containing protein n=1 Tax=Molorchus minor TaxID=1323400 RepID=A0ABQ9K2T2_9CUCU|nr:hypothetical protein NQ317_006077 [Molorchus minor]
MYCINSVTNKSRKVDLEMTMMVQEKCLFLAAAKTLKSAGCSPELRTISLGQTDDPSVLYIPQCTRVERCGGCCSHSLLSCQPKETETLSYQVMKTKYTGGKKLKYIGKEVVLVERHVSCKCDCKVKEEDCNNYQEYRESECRCACTNLDEEKKCFKSVKKLWNPELCACQCRDVAQCTSGYSFDQIDCKCVPNHMRRRFCKTTGEVMLQKLYLHYHLMKIRLQEIFLYILPLQL